MKIFVKPEIEIVNIDIQSVLINTHSGGDN